MERFQDFLLYVPGLLLALCFHEFAHAWVALRQGDETPLRDGRVTLDPRAHLDPIGSILFPAIAVFSGIPVIGWAKPVMTNPRNYRHLVSGDIKVSLAGVTANLILAILLGIVTAALLPSLMDGSDGPMRTVAQMAYYGVQVNIALMFFNLLPVPPLDGSHVFYYLLPASAGARFRALQPYGILILYALLFLGVFRLLWPLIRAVVNVLIGVPAAVLYP